MNYHTEIVTLVPLKHEGVRYEKGSELWVPDARAAQLIADGVAQRKDAAPSASGTPEPEYAPRDE